MKFLCAGTLFIFIQVSLFAQTANITSHTYKDSSSTKRYRITIDYPQVDFGPDALMGIRGVAGDINNSVDTLRQNLVNDFMSLVKNVPDVPCGQGISILETSYKTIYGNNILFSFRFESFSGIDCSNHPYTFVTTHNFSATSIGTFKISDIFLKDKPWLKFISDYCIKVLRKRAADEKVSADENITEGAGPLENNFGVFNVNENELIITFNPYQVGPWVWGIQSVSIPYSEIKNIVDPSGPLSSVIKK